MIRTLGGMIFAICSKVFAAFTESDWLQAILAERVKQCAKSNVPKATFKHVQNWFETFKIKLSERAKPDIVFTKVGRQETVNRPDVHAAPVASMHRLSFFSYTYALCPMPSYANLWQCASGQRIWQMKCTRGETMIDNVRYAAYICPSLCQEADSAELCRR